MVTNGNRNPNGSGTPTRMEGGSSSETAGGEPYDHPMMIDGVEHDMHGMAYDRDGVVRNRRRYNLPTTTGAEYGGDMDDDGWDGDDDSMVRSGMRGSMRGGKGHHMGRGMNRGRGAEHELVPFVPVPSGRSGGQDDDGLGPVGVDTINLIVSNEQGAHRERTTEGNGMFGIGSDNFLAGMLAGGGGMNRGIDPYAYANAARNDGSWTDGGLAWIVLLLALFGFGGGRGLGGFGGNGGNGCCENGVFNAQNAQLVLDAIGTNGIRQESAINTLAGNLNCGVSSIKDVLCGLAQSIAVQNGDLKAAIEAAAARTSAESGACCCKLGNAIERQGCETREAIAGVNYNMASQFAAQNNLIQMLTSQSDRAMAERFCDLSHQIEATANAAATREMQQEIQRLRDERDDQRASAQSALLLSAINRNRAFSGQYDAATTSFTGSVGQVSQFGV